MCNVVKQCQPSSERGKISVKLKLWKHQIGTEQNIKVENWKKKKKCCAE